MVAQLQNATSLAQRMRLMSKLLTTITLLCFSVATNAEVYSCTTMNGGGIYTDNEVTITPGRTFIIDINQGICLPGLAIYMEDCACCHR